MTMRVTSRKGDEPKEHEEVGDGSAVIRVAGRESIMVHNPQQDRAEAGQHPLHGLGIRTPNRRPLEPPGEPPDSDDRGQKRQKGKEAEEGVQEPVRDTWG